MTPTKLLAILTLLFINLVSAQDNSGSDKENTDSEKENPVLTWGDQGDGTYKNPIINADYSDPDVIRVGSDFYMITSTFHLSPGITVLHSKDLVNWSIIGHAITDLSQFNEEYGADKMGEYSHGVWAPAIRYHDKKFWVYVFDPSFGLFMTTATNPAGPWAPVHQVFKGRNYDDGCPFWDEKGNMYMTGARFPDWEPGIRLYDIMLWKLSPDGKEFLDEGAVIHQGDSAEATKVVFTKGYYYIFYCENEPEIHRSQKVMRSKAPYGPYEQKILCRERGTPYNAAQGGLVDTEKGDWYFLHHFDVGWNPLGRTLALNPVTWIDGWPIIGNVEFDGVGSVLMQGKKPVVGFPIEKPQTNDEFNSKDLELMWQWNHAPRNDKWSLTERKGHLRLRASVPLKEGNFFTASNTLLQRMMGSKKGEITAYVDIKGMEKGQTNGLCVVNNSMGLLKITKTGKERMIQSVIQGKKEDGKIITTDKIWLRANYLDNKYQFSYSLDGKLYESIGETFEVKGWLNWRGTEIGLFCWNDLEAKGYFDVNWFRYTFE